VLTDFDATADFVGNAGPPNPETSRRRSPRRSAETPRALLHDIISGGSFQSVTVPGAADPGFVLQSTNSASPDMLTDLGGKWHYAPLSTTK
jgi:hypothetical protein